MGPSVLLAPLLGVAALLGFGVPPVAAVAAPPTSTPLQAAFPFCSWWVETSTQNSNVAFPDTSAAYWTTPFPLDASTTVELAGTFTDGRYYSIQVYDGTGQPASQVYTTTQGNATAPTSPNYITDFNLTPGTGSVNPFATGTYPVAESSYVVTISASRGSATNWIPMPAASPGSVSGELGMLMLRAYLPSNPPVNGQQPLEDINVTADPPFSLLAEDLPTVSIVKADGSRVSFASCPAAEASRLMTTTEAGLALGQAIAGDIALQDNDRCPEVAASSPGTPCVPRLEFFRTTSGQTPFPNGDSAYVTAKYVLPPGQALVVQAVVPSTPWNVGNGSNVMAWPAASTGRTPAWNLRYFSVCNYLHRPPFPVVEVDTRQGQEWACANDVQIHEAMGNSNMLGVVTRVADRPVSIKGAGPQGLNFVWLPASRESADAEMLISVRNMLASPTFSQSATNIPTALDPPAALKTMRAYYPSASVCDIRILERFGVLKCTAVHRALERCSDINGLNQTPTGTLERDGSVRADVRGNAPAVAKAVQSCVDELLTVSGKVPTQRAAGLRHVGGCLLTKGSDCRGLDLRSAQLSGTNLSGARLAFAHLGKADLSGSRLTGIHGPRTILSGADLSNAQARGADLTQARMFSTDAGGVNLSQGTLTGSVVKSSDLSEADLSSANLSHSVIVGTNLTGADMTNADLSNVTLTNVDLSSAQVTGAQVSGAVAQDIISPSGRRCSGDLADCLLR